MIRLLAAVGYVAAMASLTVLAAWGIHEAILARSPDGEYAHDIWYVLSPVLVIGLAAIAAALIYWRPKSFAHVFVCVAWAVVYLRFVVASTWELAAAGGSTWTTYELLLAYAFPTPHFWIIGLSGLLMVFGLGLWYRNKVISHAGK